MFGATREEKAYLAPFVAILGGILLLQFVGSLLGDSPAWPLSSPMYWVLPLQTAVAGGALVWGWRHYGLRPPAGVLTGIGIGVLAFLIWIAPRYLNLAAPRLDGFDPGFFGTNTTWWWNVGLRFLRLVVVVPLAEEIFWRGYLARWLVNPDFQSVPIGTFTRQSFAVTTIGFCFEHTGPDWPAALVTGLLYNFVAWRTRSLSTCVMTHAITNLLLGLYVMRTHEWGYW